MQWSVHYAKDHQQAAAARGRLCSVNMLFVC